MPITSITGPVLRAPGPADSRRFRFRVTRAGFGLALLALAFGWQGIWAGNNLLFLIFALLAGFGLSLAGLTALAPGCVRFRRNLPESSFAGVDLHYTLEIEHPGRHWQAVGLSFCDQYTPAVRLTHPIPGLVSARAPTSGPWFYLDDLSPGETVRLEAIVRAPERGRLEFHGLWIRCQCPFGLFVAERLLPLTDTAIVYPPRRDASDYGRLTERDGWQTMALARGRQSGEAADFAGLREHQPGGPLRHIHWRLCGRLPDQLLARQYESPGDYGFTLVLDSFYRPEAEARCRPVLEHNISLALALIEQWLSAQRRVCLAACSLTPRLFHLGANGANLTEVRAFLATLEPDPTRTLGELLAKVPGRDPLVLRLPGRAEVGFPDAAPCYGFPRIILSSPKP